MTQPDTQAMRTLPPISSLGHQTDLTNRPKSILPASTPRPTPILPHIVPNSSTTTSASSYHPTPQEPVIGSASHQPYYSMHVTSSPHHTEGYAYDPTKTPPSHLDIKAGQLTSEQVLAEKRRRNAGASARFRDRRKQRERDMNERCHHLEERVKELELALSRATGQSVEEIQEGGYKPQPQRRRSSSVYSDESQEKHVMIDNFQSLGERVTELENLVGSSRREKDASVKQLQELEKENAYLRSLLTPAAAPISMAPSTPPMSVSSSPPTNSHRSVQRLSIIAADETSHIDPKKRKLSNDAASEATLDHPNTD
ncbi:hypothetical protein BGW37DRAFT_112829 [Umbelopsis sp. PMI_123]|nr:hypothetical protein BGW37DRAFT_112829 [Umbelopsis sp. PMI_123]